MKTERKKEKKLFISMTAWELQCKFKQLNTILKQENFLHTQEKILRAPSGFSIFYLKFHFT